MDSSRRALTKLIGSATIASLFRSRAARSETRSVSVGITLPLTGAGAEDAVNILHGAVLAIEEANAAGGPGGYQVQIETLDNATATAGQYDPMQAAVNARRLVIDKSVVGAIGPMNSGSGKAMAAILSQSDLATVTPSSTNPDLTDPKYAAQYRPGGKAIYFRTVTTDSYQGPNMANFMAQQLKVKSVFVLDDSGAYGVGIADAFQARAAKIGINVLGRDRVDPLAADYRSVLTKVRGLDAQALYCGSSALAGIKLVKQSYEIVPNMIKAGGDGLHQVSVLGGAGFPAAEGWYTTIAAPHMLDDNVVQPWMDRYYKRWGTRPADYSITAYDAAQVVLAAIAAVAKTNQPVTRAAVRDAIQSGRVKTLQGDLAFDANGDLESHVVSVFQVKFDPSYPPTDVVHQFKYVGAAPADAS
ncbi:branched-chain amino acid ABC transporter substrate-binding protein [Rhodopila sp.]|uniref:branched-chain amino acid ABC transporter substrate-binding protein n=1 Tax=Rhodopila sp. TaxID=2480087 RepID=UPI003D132BD6